MNQKMKKICEYISNKDFCEFDEYDFAMLEDIHRWKESKEEEEEEEQE